MAREVSSKVLDGINDLVIMAPIREGFIEAYEPVTYATRLRIIAEALNNVRGAAREFENQAPFADASERILSLLEFKAGIIDNQLLQLDSSLKLGARRYFYLIATFDGVWEPYMRLIWHPLGALLDLLFVNCEGYVFAQDNSFEDYINWVRSAQVDSSVFFTTTGLTVSDQIYLRKLERVQRELEAEPGDLAIARLAIENPGEETKRFRNNPAVRSNAMVAHRLALEALGVFYRLSDYYPPLPQYVVDDIGKTTQPDEVLLQRAMHQILHGWDYNQIEPLLAEGGPLARFRPLVEWYKSGEITLGQSRYPSLKPPVADPDPDLSEIQRGILGKFGAPGDKVRHGATILMSVTEPRKAHGFIKALLDTGVISFAGDALPAADGIYRTVGLTKNGLQRLAENRATIDALPKEFREGMHVRAPQFGDVWSNHPRNWRLPERNWPRPMPGEAARPPVQMEEVDLAMIVRLVRSQVVDHGPDLIEAEIARLSQLALANGVAIVAVDILENHYDDGDHFLDHFGLRDGISQPDPRADAEPVLTDRIAAKRDHVRLGEVLCGYGNDRQDQAPAAEEVPLSTSENKRLMMGKPDRKDARELQLNGSYLVLRKMSQDVAAFDRFKAANAAKLGGDANALVAKLLGRDPNGPSLVDPGSPKWNDFDYTDDGQGKKCPFASHIRRANPRTVEHGRPSPRLLRCGMSYGPRFQAGVDGTDNRPRGLMFMAYNSSIAEQYETVQRWLNGGNSTGIAAANNDPLTGTPPRLDIGMADTAVARDPVSGRPLHPFAKRTYRFEVNNKVVRTEIETPFVELAWGLYLFVPSRTTLKRLARSRRNYYELAEPFENAGEAYIDRLEGIADSNPDVAAAEWKRIIEDFDSKDLTQRDITPDVYSAIRYWRGGLVRVPGGIDKRSFEPGDTGPDQRQPAVIAASREKILQVLTDWQHFSTEESLRRLVDTSGSIYVAQQPDDDYVDTDLNAQSAYWVESEETNAIINGYGEDVGFGHGYDAGTKVLAWLKKDAQDRHRKLGGIGKPEFKLDLRREYLAGALAHCNREWFGLPDGNFREDRIKKTARFMAPGDWNWTPARIPSSQAGWTWDNDPARLPTCPGDCLSPSRNAFYPQSNDVSKSLAKNNGKSIQEAGRQFAHYYFNEAGIENVPGMISKRLFAIEGMTPDLAARNVIGIMLGATPPTLGNLQGILYDWLNEQTLGRYQAALHRETGRLQPSYDQAAKALRHVLAVSMCKRPSPELLFRTCKADITVSRGRPRFVDDDNPVSGSLEIKRGDKVYLPLASATQWAICQDAKYPGALESGVHVVFGGNRDDTQAPAGPPVHACPGRKLAMGAMIGIVAALLDAGRIQAQPAGMIIKLSDWDPVADA